MTWKTPIILLTGPAMAQEPLCLTDLGMPHLVSGLAECSMNGPTTQFIVRENAEILWDKIALKPGQNLEFEFLGESNTVVNRSESSTFLNSRVTSDNGNVVILSPQGPLTIDRNAQITTGSFIASSLDADSAQFLEQRDTWEFTASDNSSSVTSIRGSISTANGPVILVARGDLNVTTNIAAAKNFTAVTGTQVSLAPNDAGRTQASGNGKIVQGGNIQAGRDISLISQQAIELSGQAVFSTGGGQGRVFMRVDDKGSIGIRKGSILILGKKLFSTQEVGAIKTLGQDEGLDTLSPAVNEYPTLRRSRTTRITRPSSSPVTARSGKVFSVPRARKQSRRLLAKNTKITFLRKRSFFRTRTTAKTRKK